jgi:hypothetical protein
LTPISSTVSASSGITARRPVETTIVYDGNWGGDWGPFASARGLIAQALVKQAAQYQFAINNAQEVS